MIYHNVGLTKGEVARLRRVVKVMLENEAEECADLERLISRDVDEHTADLHRTRLDDLKRRRKYVTKANLIRIFALRGLEDMEQGGNEEETIDLMVRLGRAKGRPDGR